MHHVVVRHGNLTSGRDVVLVSFFSLLFTVRILCDSLIVFSRSCFEHEEFNLFVSSVRLIPGIGLLPVVMSLQGITEALLISNLSSGIIHAFLKNQDHRPEK